MELANKPLGSIADLEIESWVSVLPEFDAQFVVWSPVGKFGVQKLGVDLAVVHPLPAGLFVLGFDVRGLGLLAFAFSGADPGSRGAYVVEVLLTVICNL